MCTAISHTAGSHYFGRNLDYEHEFGEKVTITPREYVFNFSNGEQTENHPAIIGMALPYRNYPLYFDAINEFGLAVAGLNFPEYACYKPKIKGKINVASYELIPWLLCHCRSVKEAKRRLFDVNITNAAFDALLPPSNLHWVVADKELCIAVEQTQEGLWVYENPVGVLTNSPDFPMQLFQLNNYRGLSAETPENTFSSKLDLQVYSRGMGAMSLPGDVSSMSRFVRASFNKLNAIFDGDESKNVHQFFHLLGSVAQIKGCAKVGEGFEMTNYETCYNTARGICYYKSYYNSRITAVDMHRAELNGNRLTVLDLTKEGDILFQI